MRSEPDRAIAAWPAAGSMHTQIRCFIKPEVTLTARLAYAANLGVDRRSRRASMRRRRARGAVGAQRPLQFADRGICRYRRHADVADRFGLGRSRHTHHRGVAIRPCEPPARARPRGRARTARQGRSQHHRTQPAGVIRFGSMNDVPGRIINSQPPVAEPLDYALNILPLSADRPEVTGTQPK